MKIDISKASDRYTVASILIANGYTVREVKKTKTESVGLEVWKGEKKDEEN